MSKNINTGLGKAAGKLQLIWPSHIVTKLKITSSYWEEITNPRLILRGQNVDILDQIHMSYRIPSANTHNQLNGV